MASANDIQNSDIRDCFQNTSPSTEVSSDRSELIYTTPEPPELSPKCVKNQNTPMSDKSYSSSSPPNLTPQRVCSNVCQSIKDSQSLKRKSLFETFSVRNVSDDSNGGNNDASSSKVRNYDKSSAKSVSQNLSKMSNKVTFDSRTRFCTKDIESGINILDVCDTDDCIVLSDDDNNSLCLDKNNECQELNERSECGPPALMDITDSDNNLRGILKKEIKIEILDCMKKEPTEAVAQLVNSVMKIEPQIEVQTEINENNRHATGKIGTNLFERMKCEKEKCISKIDVVEDVEFEDDDDDLLESYISQNSRHIKKEDPAEEYVHPIKMEPVDPDDGMKTTITLDQLLAEHKQNKLERHIISQIKDESKAVEVDDLLPEHKQQLSKLNTIQNTIKDVPPGEKVFDGSFYGYLFRYPKTLTLKACGFNPGRSQIDRKLSSLPHGIQQLFGFLDPLYNCDLNFIPKSLQCLSDQIMLISDQLLVFLEPGFISLTFPHISSKEEFLTFCLYLLSVSPDIQTSSNLHQILYTEIQKRRSPWFPSVLDVARILVNYGSTLKGLCRKDNLLSFTHENLLFSFDQKSFNGTNGLNEYLTEEPHPAEFSIENLRLVMQILANGLAISSEKYSFNDTMALMLMVLRVALDVRLTSGILRLDTTSLISTLIHAVHPEDWQSWVNQLVGYVADFNIFHHNMVNLVGLMPMVERGTYLQRLLSLVFINKLMNFKSGCSYTSANLKLSECFKILDQLQLSEENPRCPVDYYQSCSILSLLDYLVGSEVQAISETKDFVILTELLQLKIGKMRESGRNVDQLLVKDAMVALLSKWNIYHERAGSNELFSTSFLPATPLKVQSVVSSQSQFSDSDGDDDEMS